MAARSGRPRLVPRMRTVAGQVFLVQLAIVVLLVATALVVLVVQTHRDARQEAEKRSLSVAETFASSPGIEAALKSPDPTAILQPRAQEATRRADIGFIVVVNPQGIRYTHPDPTYIGGRFVGDLDTALAGEVVIETADSEVGRIVQVVVPVYGMSGDVIGAVSAGMAISQVQNQIEAQFPLLFGVAGGVLLLAAGATTLVNRRLRRQTRGLGPAEITRMYEHHDAVLHAVREGVLIVSADRRLLLANDEARRLLDLAPDVEGRPVTELGLDAPTTQLLESGRPASDEVHAVGDRLLAVNQRPTDLHGGPPGTVATLRDTTELSALTDRVDLTRGRLRLLYDAGTRVGTTLDMVRTCEELAEFAATDFADYVSVDLATSVLRGEEPEAIATGREMRRVAFAGLDADAALFPVGHRIRFVGTPAVPGAVLANGADILEGDLGAYAGWREQDAERARAVVAAGLTSLIAVPLRARGVVLGATIFWRTDRRDAFDEEDRSLAEELVARAAVSVDNARRYSREHTMAVTLQRSLLPHGLPEQNALVAAMRYLPAQAGLGGVGGDWFDIIPLPGGRVALVVGDVVGHGLHAAATMGRLRTAVHNFSTLDLPPDELLWHLDELVARLDHDAADAPGADDQGPRVTGATCVYVIYDPVTGHCSMARAGHLQPALLLPDGTASFADVPGGPPLGLGGLPFETLELQLPEGTRLVLFTDGLVEDRSRDIDEGLERLRTTLEAHTHRTVDGLCEATLDALVPDTPSDDIALLIGRTRIFGGDRVAECEVPSDPAAVAEVRAFVERTLADWGLVEEAFTTELILSELVTNSIRYATGPVHVRVIRDRSLICEVSDRSSTSPHLRRAATTDEGGRGLFLVSQVADRWGTRYTAGGKVIWTEQGLS
ncbi:SpoIIE family protein phosphatase [Streptomyces sp. NPDC049906]|uniref:SpoIIE family protein phosphatase n=1 Tax=Streptomyces sp. NPDC049906 TaxID=3155656 RepID=UPI00343A14A6